LRHYTKATAADSPVLLEELIKKDPEVHKLRLEHEMTPLHDAALRGYLEATQLILAAGGDVNARDNDGATPLHLSAHEGHTEVVELLLQNGADMHAKAGPGVTAMEIASANDRVEVLTLLRKYADEVVGTRRK
jgi:ankyrin repeat protein